MPTIPFAALLLSAQPAPVAPGQSALAQCLAGFVAAQQQAGTEVADFTNLLATACPDQEQAYRADYVAGAAQRGVRFLDADGEAFRQILAIRNGYRDAFLAARNTCAPGTRRR